MISHNRLQAYFETTVRELDALERALDLSDEEIQASPLVLRGMKYSMIVLAEVIAEFCQHILAKEHRTAVSGYGETLAKAASVGILDDDLYKRLAPFLRFRNLLVHGYWKMDDDLLLRNLRDGISDLRDFAGLIGRRLTSPPAANRESG